MSLALLGVSAAEAAKVPILKFGVDGTQGGQLKQARGIAVNETGAGGVPAGTVYVAELGNNRIQSFKPNYNGTPEDPSDDSYEFLSAWGQDVDVAGGTGFEICTVATSCKAGVSGGVAGQLNQGGQFNGLAGGIAVHQATGVVSVFDRNNRRVQQFDATGNFLRAWGKDVDTGGGTDFEVCEVAVSCKQGSAGTKGGEFGSNTLVLAGIASDAAGNVYVADAENKRVQKFSATGAFLAAGGWDVVDGVSNPGAPGDDTTAPINEYEVCTVASTCKAGLGGTGAGQFGPSNLPSFLTVSPAGVVYVVGRSDGTIYRLDSSLAFDPTFAPTSVPSTNNNRNAVAFESIAGDPAGGHLLFTKPASTTIFELDPTAQSVVAEHPAGATEWVGLAADPGQGRIFGARTTNATEIHVFAEGPPSATIAAASNLTGTRATANGAVNPNGTAVSECLFEYGPTTAFGSVAPCSETPAEIGSGSSSVAVHADLTGLVPNGATYHFRLVASNVKGTARSSSQSFTTPDTVLTTAPSAVAGTTAMLNGTVNPDTASISECLFEWGSTTAYGNVAPCVESPGSIGSGTSPVPVHAEIDGLSPAATYHFRLRATYPTGPVLGDDIVFQTLGASIAATWAQGVSDTGATLKAEIDPEAVATTYRFEYGTTADYGQQTPEMSVGSDSATHEVDFDLQGLLPSTTYHYRVVASNADAVTEGPDHTFITYPVPTEPRSDCANQAFRTGASAFLPDCRAYEMVSPTDKNGGDIKALFNLAASDQILEAYDRSSGDGDGITYSSKASFGDGLGAPYTSQYLARRDPDSGWSTQNISPPRKGFAGPGRQMFEAEYRAFSEDLSQGWLVHDADPPLADCAPPDSTNLYRRFNETGGYEALNCEPIPSELGLYLIELQGVSADGCRAVFRSKAKLTPDANPQSTSLYQLYQSDCAGNVDFIGELPGGVPCTQMSSAGSGVFGGSESNHRSKSLERAFSGDARRLYWSCGDTLYLRTDPDLAVEGDEEVELVAPGARFHAASPDGSRALFTTASGLWAYDADSGATEIAGGIPAHKVLGASEDVSRAYFVSTQALPGAGENSEGDSAVPAGNNLYLYEDDEGQPAFSFVATLSHPGDLATGQAVPSPVNWLRYLRASRVSPSGLHAAFISFSPITGYDNTDRATGALAAEVFLYDAAAGVGDGEIVCVSCNPSNARPVAGNISPNAAGNGFTLGAADIPGWVNQLYASRPLSEDGSRLFFNSYDALVLRDTNGRQDVYEWLRAGDAEECESLGAELYVAEAGGCISLISSGQDPEESEFVDADRDGSDVFIRTGESLLVQDPGLIDIYDARIDGGFPPPPSDPPACEGEACQSPPAPPSFQMPSSSAFSGPTDPVAGRQARQRGRRCGKGKRRVVLRGKARCLKKRARGKNRRPNRAHRGAGR